MSTINKPLPANTGLPGFWESILFYETPVYYFDDVDDLADNEVVLDNGIVILWGGEDLQVKPGFEPIGWKSFNEKITLRDILSLGNMKVIWPGIVQVWNHKGNSMWPSQQLEGCTISIERVKSFEVVATAHSRWRRTIPNSAWKIAIHKNSEGTSLWKEIPMPLGASPEGWRIVSDALISEYVVTEVQHQVMVVMSEPYPDGNITRIDTFSRNIISGRLWVDFDLDQLEPNTIVINGDIWDFDIEDIIWAAEIDMTKPSIIDMTQKQVFWGNMEFVWIMPGWEIQVYENIRNSESKNPIDLRLVSNHQVVIYELLRDNRKSKGQVI